ncbi:MAG: hypothetical protein JSS51_03595 [Planctomycetes bacterium]|nr:hypothetical protein [Planctomycetota bacterium]
MLKLSRMVNKGQPIFASDWNQLIDDLERALQIRAGPGLVGSWPSSGLMVALAQQQPDFLVWSRITARTRSAADVAENIRYDVKGIFEQGAVLTNVYPSCGRPVKAAQASITRIYPAEIGALCFIARNKQTDGTVRPELWFPGTGGEYEGLAVKKCS